MVSFVRSLKRAVSTGRDGDSPQSSPLALNQTRSSSIPASPSFSDFSLSTHTDAANELGAAKRATETPRTSFERLEDYLSSSPRSWLRSPFLGGCPPTVTPAVPIPASNATATHLASQPSAPPSTLPRRREGKISGMDYYDYCELIRSSSL